MSDIADRYLAVWNETDPNRRRALIAGTFTEDASYTDPLGAVRGHDGIDTFIAGAQTQFPGLVFTLPAEPDAHHNLARFQWHLGAPGATEPLVIGFDVVVVTDGRISAVGGFLDKVPA